MFVPTIKLGYEKHLIKNKKVTKHVYIYLLIRQNIQHPKKKRTVEDKIIRQFIKF